MIITIDLSDEMTVLDKVTKQPCKYVRLLLKRTPVEEISADVDGRSSRGPYTTTKAKKNTHWKEEDNKILLKMYEQGASYAKIARALHRTTFAVGARVTVLMKKGILKELRRPAGDKKGDA
jgi:DNA-binding NarL/FixJ family response regulator